MSPNDSFIELHGVPKDSDDTLVQSVRPKGVLTNEAFQSKNCSIVDEDWVERDRTIDPTSGTERWQVRSGGAPFT